MNAENDVLNRFRFHPATEVTGPIHDNVRTAFEEMAVFVLNNVPAGRHQSLSLTALQEAMMWSNAGVACDFEGERGEQLNPNSGPQSTRQFGHNESGRFDLDEGTKES